MKLRTAHIKDTAVTVRLVDHNPKHIVLAKYQDINKLHTRAVYEGISDLLQMSSSTEKQVRARVRGQIRSLRTTRGLPVKPRATGSYALALSWQKVGQALETSMQKL